MYKSKGDEYYTPKILWDNIKKFIPKDKIIYEPFNNIKNPNSFKSHKYLKELGFKMKPIKIYNPDTGENDFFKNIKTDYDIVVGNPPFSIKKKIIEKLVNDDTPFILIIPLQTIACNYISKLSDNIKIICPKKRMNFSDINHNICCFPCVYLCYKMDNILKKFQYI